jgi:adenylate kinase
LPMEQLAVWQRVQQDQLPIPEGEEGEEKDVSSEEYQAELASTMLPEMAPVDAGYLVKRIVKIGLYVGERAAIEQPDMQFDDQVGDKQGFGVTLSPGGDVYVGMYSAGGRGGLGALRTKAGTTYVGEWKAGKRHGKGSMTYADGGVYTGSWSYGKRHGEGTFTFASGDSYTGAWHAGDKHGEGKYTASAAGVVYQGTWKFGSLLTSKVIFKTAADAAYYGGFDKDGRPTGPGAFAFGNGVSASGRYEAPPVEDPDADPPAPALPAAWYGGEYGKVSAATDGDLKKKLTAVKPMLNVVIAGAPASGKGTQCEKIVETYGLFHVSTGDILREAAADEGNELGQKAKECMDAGELVPDELITGLLVQKLDNPEVREKGWLLDGYPRTEAQAKGMEEYFLIPNKCVLLDVPEEVLVKRVTGRRKDPETGTIYHLETNPPTGDDAEEILARLEQRSDDTEEALKTRLVNFNSNKSAIESQFRTIAVNVDGNRAPEEVWAEINEFLAQ